MCIRYDDANSVASVYAQTATWLIKNIGPSVLGYLVYTEEENRDVSGGI